MGGDDCQEAGGDHAQRALCGHQQHARTPAPVLGSTRQEVGAKIVVVVGLAQACLDESLRYAGERRQFGRPISAFQAIQFKLADMAMEIELSRLMYYKAAWLHMQGLPYTKEASMAKLFSSETAKRCADQAVQIHGGYGFMDEYPVSRYWRNVKVHEIGEGTSEVQRQIIAKHL